MCIDGLQLAAANGDMRRALEACTAALELKVKEAAAEQADMIASGLSSGEILTQPSQCSMPFHITRTASRNKLLQLLYLTVYTQNCIKVELTAMKEL